MLRLTLSREVAKESAIVLAGLIFLAIGYFHHRSLWLDEASLAVNVIARTNMDLFKPLDKLQMAPFLYLQAVKTFGAFWNYDEYALRAVSLFSSFGTLFLMWALCRQFLSQNVTLLSLVFLSVCGSMWYYAQEFKPYASDAFFAVAIMYTALRWRQTPSIRCSVAFGLIGALAVWCSFPAAFVLAGLGIVLFYQAVLQKDRKHLCLLLAVGGLWCLSFGTYFFKFLKNDPTQAGMQVYWNSVGGFVPFSSLAGQWIWGNFVSATPFGTQSLLACLVGLILVIGTRTLWRREKITLFLLTGPFIIAVLATLLKLYPYSFRLYFFTVPAFILISAEGVETIRQALARRVSSVGLGVWVLVGIFCVFRLSNIPDSSEYSDRTSKGFEAMKELVQKDDWIAVSYSSETVFLYYAYRFALPAHNQILGHWHKRINLQEIFSSLEGKNRAWIVSDSYRQPELPGAARKYAMNNITIDGFPFFIGLFDFSVNGKQPNSAAMQSRGPTTSSKQ